MTDFLDYDMVVFEILAVVGTALSVILLGLKVISKIRKSKCVVIDDEGVTYKVDFSDVNKPRIHKSPSDIELSTPPHKEIQTGAVKEVSPESA